ncbi:MAG: 3-oxoacyl-[acyl-carrier-protein] reductase [Treponema sp. GWB1_62_6]|nr:MAG: 3-oxoacyl-[acyl-carrier-protein] reductase [Treponema sp. GWA1_62_8]OHE64449.1 MAG: 3-oxoacyl-[acyl-carrier-protein] reductase [Treponema sp. GWC1_61_84]OHE68176.1 MAG: 3-oxoacyl-[acyl-carrier-protein] reductase [Treponema sp. GWB1_62_6]OHE76341.1 MAG: 3-oxoacyl-[acyl-carrier-protein] reductase [Treponema sp. RIFOXYC1_FULL_61_9]HCM26715.1 3-oxoacyl-[acyl-carrier-protein] reductase [Treponema sp.]
MRLENKKALVTGASRGIGRAVADRFLAEGAEVWGLGTKEPSDLAARISAAGGKLHWLVADVGALDSIEGIIEAALKESGGFDVLVNNAGITKDGLSFRMSVADFQRVLDVNLTGAFLVARTVGRDMIRKKTGSIINMSSVVGQHGNGGQANYAASKAGIIGVSKSLAQEVASRGVRVNAIAPGYIATDMTDAIPESAKEKLMDHIPLKRLGTAEDIAGAALFLASDDSKYITGQVLAVDGGMFI